MYVFAMVKLDWWIFLVNYVSLWQQTKMREEQEDMREEQNGIGCTDYGLHGFFTVLLLFFAKCLHTQWSETIINIIIATPT